MAMTSDMMTGDDGDDGRDIFPMGDESGGGSFDGSSQPAAAAEQPAPAQPKPDEAPWWKAKENDEVEYTWNGKPIKAPLSAVLQKASMGHDYAQKMEQFNKERTTHEERLKAAERWNEYQEYADKNPEWLQAFHDHWSKRDSWRNTVTVNEPDNPIAPVVQKLTALEERFGKVEPMLTEYEQRQETARIEAEDKEFQSARQATLDEFKGIDFTALDSDGKSLEYRILEHGDRKGISDFKLAFLDFYQKDLGKYYAERARNEVLEEQKKLRKDGFIGRSPTPTQGPKSSRSVRDMSYDDISNDVKQNLGSYQAKYSR